MLIYDELRQATADTLVRAGSSFRPDQIAAYRRAIDCETNGHAKWALQKTLENALIAAEKSYPLCDDTGIPHVFLQLGAKAVLPPDFIGAINAGVADGLRRLPGRPMAVRGDALQRISQEQGLYDDPGKLEMAPLQLRPAEGSLTRLTVLMYGGGPEIRGKTLRVYHRHTLDRVKEEMISWAAEGASKLGCLPCVFSFGVGRSNYEAAALSLEAMAEGCFDRQSDLERSITQAVNAKHYGALGLGGEHSALATFVKIGPQRASGVRIVSMRCGCCFDPRRASIEL